MKVYDTFLADVIKKNSDEFLEPADVVSRFDTLKHSKELLLTDNDKLSRALNLIND